MNHVKLKLNWQSNEYLQQILVTLVSLLHSIWPNVLLGRVPRERGGTIRCSSPFLEAEGFSTEDRLTGLIHSEKEKLRAERRRKRKVLLTPWLFLGSTAAHGFILFIMSSRPHPPSSPSTTILKLSHEEREEDCRTRLHRFKSRCSKGWLSMASWCMLVIKWKDLEQYITWKVVWLVSVCIKKDSLIVSISKMEFDAQ